MQLSFSFSINKDIYDVRNFIVHDGNRHVFEFITSSFLFNNNVYLLTGPKSSGKTYICNIWHKLQKAIFLDKNIFQQNKSDFINFLKNEIKNNQKYILEDIENIKMNEEYFLFLINTIIEKNAILLITSKECIDEFNFKIPDLESRFKNTYNFILQDLDNNSKEQILLKLLTDKQINIDYKILNYVSQKISNNYNAIIDFVNNLEKEVEQNNIKKLNIAVINKILS